MRTSSRNSSSKSQSNVAEKVATGEVEWEKTMADATDVLEG